jgi:hypothetical protein
LQWADENADDVVSPGGQTPELLSAGQPGVEIRIVVVDLIWQGAGMSWHVTAPLLDIFDRSAW